MSDAESEEGSGNYFFPFTSVPVSVLPPAEIDYDDIDLSTTFLGRRFSAPLIIDSMTGGADEATVIHGRLGELAEK